MADRTVRTMVTTADTLVGLLARTAPLDEPPPVDPADCDIQAAVARLDASGRLTDRDLLAGLGWEPGRALLVRRDGRSLRLRCAGIAGPGDSLTKVDARWRVLIPRTLRHALALLPGKPLLLVAADGDTLTVLPASTALDLLTTQPR